MILSIDIHLICHFLELKEKLKLEARKKELKQTIKENSDIVKALVDL